MTLSRLVLYSLGIVSLGATLSLAEPLTANASPEELDAVLRFERAWCDAYLHGDIDFLRAHVASDFTLTGSNGHIDTLAGDIAELQAAR
ncbi:MAG: nuclear transport factor 2 family protein [Chthoniobacterales bacterium]|nr:nuclear transport factor 2 family protein [Chthoniobacterales bacterium]